MRRLARIAGTLMIVGGVGALAWAITVWQWQDPFSAVTHALEQRELSQSFERRLERDPRLAATGSLDVEEAAERWRTASKRGDAVARLRIPALGVDEIVVNGTDTETLKRGPGRYLDSAMPGEGELVYIAGHRTTYGAPFSRIDRLRKGDRIFVELPYAAVEYVITGHRIVPATRTSELRSRGFEQLALQACEPRFFATHRYIVYARPVAFTAAERAGAELAAGG